MFWLILKNKETNEYLALFVRVKKAFTPFYYIKTICDAKGLTALTRLRMQLCLKLLPLCNKKNLKFSIEVEVKLITIHDDQ